MMTLIRFSNLSEYDEMVKQYENWSMPVLLIGDDQDIKLYFGSNLRQYNFDRYILEVLKIRLLAEGLFTSEHNTELRLHDKPVLNYRSFLTNYYTSVTMTINMKNVLNAYGFSNSEIVNLIIDATEKYMKERRQY